MFEGMLNFFTPLFRQVLASSVGIAQLSLFSFVLSTIIMFRKTQVSWFLPVITQEVMKQEVITSRMPLLSPNQQRQGTEGFEGRHNVDNPTT